MSKIYYVICEHTGEEDAIEADTEKEAIAIFASDKEIDRWDDEDKYLSIKATVLLS